MKQVSQPQPDLLRSMKNRFSQNGTRITKIIILLSFSFYLSYLCSSFFSYQSQIPVKKEIKSLKIEPWK